MSKRACKHCGGGNVQQVAVCVWNEAQNEWVYDDHMEGFDPYCRDCDTETELVDRPICISEVKVLAGANEFDLLGCQLLSPRAGESDYGEPVAFITPKGELWAFDNIEVHLSDEDGIKVLPEDIEWDEVTE